MSITRNSFFGYALVLIGLGVGAMGKVQTGLIFIAVGTASVSLATKAISRVERYLPLALALGLCALAIALPGGR